MVMRYRLLSILAYWQAAKTVSAQPAGPSGPFDPDRCCPLILQAHPGEKCYNEALEAFNECAGSLESCEWDDISDLGFPQLIDFLKSETTKCAAPQFEAAGCAVRLEDNPEGVADPCVKQTDHRKYCNTPKNYECREVEYHAYRKCLEENVFTPEDIPKHEKSTWEACEISRCELICGCKTAGSEFVMECFPDSFMKTQGTQEIAQMEKEAASWNKTPEECRAECKNFNPYAYSTGHIGYRSRNEVSLFFQLLKPHLTIHEARLHYANMRQRVKMTN